MILRSALQYSMNVTFSIECDRPVSVVGDFNGWDPFEHPLTRDDAGRCVATLELDPGTYRFRYLADNADFFDDPQADRIVDNGLGGTHSVLVVEVDSGPATAPDATAEEAQSFLDPAGSISSDE